MKKMVQKEIREKKKANQKQSKNKTKQNRTGDQLQQETTTSDQLEAELSQARRYIMHLGRGRSQGRSLADYLVAFKNTSLRFTTQTTKCL